MLQWYLPTIVLVCSNYGRGNNFSHLAFSARLRIDGTLEGEPSEDANAAVKEVQDKGVLIGAGFIAGESLMGVLLRYS